MAARSDAPAEEAAGPGHLLPLAACAGLPAGRVGRKAAVLAWAGAHGIATPGGVVVGAERFRQALAACGAADRARYVEEAAHRLAPGHVLNVAASVVEAMGAPAVDALARADAEAVLARVGPGPVVCRSSSAMEDGRGAAFPGLFLSVLGIDSAAGLAGAIAACWRSAFAADAVRYLLRVRAEPVDLSLAVLVQRQVAAPSFGVYAGADPVTGARTACAELGGPAPDAVMGAGRAGVRARREGGRWAAAGGVEPALAASLEALHRIGGRLRRHLGAEVDLEFALPAGGAPPVVLQCRPLTGVGSGTAGPAPDGALAGRGCAAGTATGLATAGGPGVAVVEELTASDYGVVFRSAAVVAERDASPLSHAAILCRELGVPFVSGVAGARRRLLGRPVAVEGGSGHVRLLDGATDTPAASPPPRDGGDGGDAAGPVVGAVELLLRVLAEARPGRPVAVEADRIARRCARALGGRAVLVAPSPVDPADRDRLERLGADVLGPAFSAGAFLAEVAGTRRPAAP